MSNTPATKTLSGDLSHEAADAELLAFAKSHFPKETNLVIKSDGKSSWVEVKDQDKALVTLDWDSLEMRALLDENFELEVNPQPVSVPTVDSSMVVGVPSSTQESRNITVYAQSITPISYGDDDPVVSFDVVFSVGIVADNRTRTYQVVKRIGIDRQKIAADAEATVPVSIVEAKKPLKEDKAFSTSRMRALAGLS